MKPRTMRIWLIAAIVGAGSLVTLQAQTEAYPQDVLRGSVRAVIERGGSYSAKSGVWKQESFVPVDERVYAAGGLLVERTTYSYKSLRKSDLTRKVVYTFDSIASESRCATFNSAGIPISSEVTAFDAGKGPAEVQTRDRSGAMLSTTAYKYDAENRLIEEARYNARQVLLGRIGYGYDFQGRLTEEVEYNSVGDVLRRRVRSFNASGAIAEETTYDFTVRGVDSLTQIVYTYDSLGRPERIKWYNASAIRYTGGEFKPRLARELTFSYGADGRLVEMRSVDQTVGYEERIVLQNDDQGNWIRKDHYRRPLDAPADDFTPHESFVRTIVYYTS